jgi:heterodisulfide reductase subunit A
MNQDVLVIGAGIAGIEASLLLAGSGRKVYLIEKTSMIGGNLVKYEEVFPNMECSTCMLAPKQQDLLQNANIELLTMADVLDVSGKIGDFKVKIAVQADYVSAVDCIGCGACYEPCPISIPNEFEENLSSRKAIFVPCPGALPNVPVIDKANCLRFTKGEECALCQESCMFEAIDYSKQDRQIELEVGAIIVCTGFQMFDLSSYSKYGSGEIPAVYTEMQFERLFASNGPTLGDIRLRNGRTPEKIAIIQDVGKKTVGYNSPIASIYPFKLMHYIAHKLHNAEIFCLYDDLFLPGKHYQAFFEEAISPNVHLERYDDVSVEANGDGALVKFSVEGDEKRIEVDMVILASALVPRTDALELANLLGIDIAKSGFLRSNRDGLSTLATSREGIFVAGCAEGIKDIAHSVEQASAAVGMVLSSIRNEIAV